MKLFWRLGGRGFSGFQGFAVDATKTSERLMVNIDPKYPVPGRAMVF